MADYVPPSINVMQRLTRRKPRHNRQARNHKYHSSKHNKRLVPTQQFQIRQSHTEEYEPPSVQQRPSSSSTQLIQTSKYGPGAVGGEVAFKLVQAVGISGQAKTTHVYAKIMVGEEVRLTDIAWGTNNPVWDQVLVFDQLSA